MDGKSIANARVASSGVLSERKGVYKMGKPRDVNKSSLTLLPTILKIAFISIKQFIDNFLSSFLYSSLGKPCQPNDPNI